MLLRSRTRCSGDGNGFKSEGTPQALEGYERLLSTSCLERRALLSGLSCLYVVSSGSRALPRFLRLAEVLEMTGMGKTFIYARMKDGIIPKQIK